MFLIDDLLMMPARGIMAVFREVYNAAQQEGANEAESIRTELSELYMLLETQQLSEADFDRREKELLDRLDDLEKRGPEETAEGEDADREEGDDEEEDMDTDVELDDDELEEEELEEDDEDEFEDDEDEWEEDYGDEVDEDADDEEEAGDEEVELAGIEIELDETVGDIPGGSSTGTASRDGGLGGG